MSISIFKRALCFILIAFSVASHASTNIVSPTVSGHWTLSGSPYLVFNNIAINAGTSLSIDQGVQVIFQGSYTLDVNGSLFAIGTVSQPISFNVYDTTGWSDTSVAGGWKGMNFTGTTDSSIFSHCGVSDMKGGISITYSKAKFNDCDFYHNKGNVVLSITLSNSTNYEIKKCNFHDNISAILVLWGDPALTSTVRMDSCNMNDNTIGSGMYCSYLNLLIDHNSFYNNQQLDTSMHSVIEMYNCKAIVSGNKIYENTLMQCAALASWNGSADINGNYICNNSVLLWGTGVSCGHVQGGAAIRITNEGATIPNSCTIRNNVIANNVTAYIGAGVYVIGANVDIYNNDIVNNVAQLGGGIHGFDNPGYKLNVKNNIFLNNVGIGNHDSVNIDGSIDTLIYEYNWSQNSYRKEVTANSLILTLLGDTLQNFTGTSPGFVSPTLTPGVTESALAANFALLRTSACIDKGNITGITPGLLDYIGNNRTYGSSIDIGAYEFRPPLFSITPEEQKTINVYPNPASNLVFVSTPEATGKVTITNISGQTVMESKVTSTSTFFDIHSIPRGTYLVVWNDGTEYKTVQKILVE